MVVISVSGALNTILDSKSLSAVKIADEETAAEIPGRQINNTKRKKFADFEFNITISP
jgi:hypothetical protein